jgi:hypothetical protein
MNTRVHRLGRKKSRPGADSVSELRKVQDREGKETMFGSLSEAVLDAIVVNKQGTIVLVNAQRKKLLRYKREELLNHSIEGLIPERFRGKCPGHRSGFSVDPRLRPVDTGLELFGLLKDDTEFPIGISLSHSRSTRACSFGARPVISRHGSGARTCHSLDLAIRAYASENISPLSAAFHFRSVTDLRVASRDLSRHLGEPGEPKPSSHFESICNSSPTILFGMDYAT